MNRVVRGIIIFLVIILLLVGTAGALIFFDVFGLGTQIIGPYLMDVPVVNLILPEMPESAEGEGSGYNFESVEEAVEILKITEEMLKESNEKADVLTEQLTQLTAEVERLEVFEENQLQFEADKAAFDQLIGDASEDLDYKDWFETMYPENAAKIYEEVIQDVALAEEQQELINIYENMKASNAADVLAEMTTTKLDLVSRIIDGVSDEQAASILAAMEPATAAKITTYLSPEQ